jgi:hypothetical protein
VAADVNDGFKPSWNPLACSDTEMLPNTLLIAKLSVLILVAGGFWQRIGRHGYSSGIIGHLPDSSIVDATFHLLFAAAGICILLNRFVRPMSIFLGILVLFVGIGSATALRGHDFLCGSLLLLTGLQGKHERPILIRWQVVLIHAAVLIEATRVNGWSDSWAMERWIPEDFSNPVFVYANELLPPGWFGVMMAWFIVIAELMLVFAFCQRRFQRFALWGGLVLHLGIYTATGTTASAAFTAALFTSYISFLKWPKMTICAVWPRSCGWPLWLRIALDKYDFDHRIDWPLPPDPNAELEVSYGNHHSQDVRALRDLLLLFPSFYFFLFVVFAANQLLWPPILAVAINGSLGMALLWFFSVSSFRSIRARWRRKFSKSAEMT